MRKIGHFLIKKRERHDSDHIHTLWEQTDGEDTERTDGRSAPGGASLAAFPVWGVLFNWFPTFFNPFEKCILLTLFSFLSKEHVFAVFYQLFSMWPFSTRFSALFPFCPCVSLSETCFPTTSLTVVIKQNQNQNNGQKCVRVPPVLCAVAINNGNKRSVLLIGRYMPIYWQYPNAIST